MNLIMDGLLLAAACFAGTYCFVLARRVRALKELDNGIGAAIVRMTHALESARRALEEAKATSQHGNSDLKELVARAEGACGQLRMLLAATRDLPVAPAPPPAPRPRADAVDRERRALLESRATASMFGTVEREREPARLRPSRPARPAAAGRARAASVEDELLAALADLAGAGRA
jgi:hypothetical protein